MSAVDLPWPKLAWLIPNARQRQRHEVIATVRAIGRTLQGAGADFHALAKSIETPEIIIIRPAFPGQPAPIKPRKGPPVWTDLRRTERLRWLELAIAADWLSEWERDLASELWGQVWSQPHKSITPKQQAALNALTAKAWHRGERA